MRNREGKSHMTVKELREQLDNYPDDLVIAIGYGAIEEDCEGNVLPDIVFLNRDILCNSRGDQSLYVLRIF